MKKLYRLYLTMLVLLLLMSLLAVPAFAAGDTEPGDAPAAAANENMWVAAKRIIVDVYTQIVGISTVLAGLMSAVAVIGAKLSNNQHKVDQAWDWLKRI